MHGYAEHAHPMYTHAAHGHIMHINAVHVQVVLSKNYSDMSITAIVNKLAFHGLLTIFQFNC